MKSALFTSNPKSMDACHADATGCENPFQYYYYEALYSLGHAINRTIDDNGIESIYDSDILLQQFQQNTSIHFPRFVNTLPNLDNQMDTSRVYKLWSKLRRHTIL